MAQPWNLLSSVAGDPIVVGAGVVLVVMVFCLSAWHKWRDLASFEMSIAAYDLVKPALIWPLARGLATLELLLVPALTWPASRAAAFGLAALLLSTYGLAMAINLVRGRTQIDCGCGADTQRLSWRLVMRNALLAGAAGAWSLPGVERALDWRDAVFVVAVALAFCALYQMTEELIRQGTRLDALKRAAHEEHA